MLGSLSLIKYEPFVTTKVTNQNNYIEKSISIHNGQEIVQKKNEWYDNSNFRMKIGIKL